MALLVVEETKSKEMLVKRVFLRELQVGQDYAPHQAAVQDELALGRFNITVLDARNEHEGGLVCIYMVVEVVSIYDFLNMFS